MNYCWKNVYKANKQSGNALLAYDAICQEGKIRVIIYVTPKIGELGNKRITFSRVYFRTKENVSDYSFHAVSDDIIELCAKEFVSDAFFKTSFNEYNIISRLPSVNAFTFGDYYNIDEWRYR